MTIQHNALSLAVIDAIDDHLASVIGPMAVIFCEQCVDTWIEQEMAGRKAVDLRTIPAYVRLLCNEIDDSADQQTFMNLLKADAKVSIYLR